MLRYPVVRLGQGGQDFIKIEDFRGYVNQANSSMKTVADIARAHDLSDEERNAINTEINKVAGYTIAMAQRPTPEPSSLTRASSPPWLAAGVVGVVAGGLLAHFVL